MISGGTTYRKERFRLRGHIFADAVLSLNQQSSSFNDAFGVEKVSKHWRWIYTSFYVRRGW